MNEKTVKYSKGKSKRKDILNSMPALTFIAIMVFFLTFVLGTFGVKSGYGDERILDLARRILSFKSDGIFVFSNGSIEELCCFIPFIIGVSQFAFLTNRAHCYDVLSLPLSRKTIFKNRFLLPIAIVFAITLVVKIVVLSMNLDVYGYSGDLMLGSFTNLVLCIQAQFTSYVLGVAGCLLCGRLADALLFSAAVPTVVFFVGEAVRKILNVTLVGDAFPYILNDWESICTSYGPLPADTITEYMPEFGIYRQWYVSALWMIVTVAVVFILKNYFMYHFKPENSGMKVSNTKAFCFTCFTASGVIAYYSVSYILWEIGMDTMWSLVGGNETLILIASCVVIAVLSAAVVGFAISLDFKKIKLSLCSGLCMAGIFILTAILGYTGLFGCYNAFLKGENVKSVKVALPFDEYILDTGSSDVGLWDRVSRDSDIPTVQFEKPEDIETCINITKSLSKSKEHETFCDVTFTYTLKNGKEVERYYSYINREALSELIKLWDKEEVKQEYKAVLDGVVYDENVEINITSKQGVKTDIKSLITKEQFDEIKSAVYEDVKNLSSTEWFSGTSDCLGKISIVENDENDTPTFETYNDETEEYSGFAQIPVRKNMVKTISLLKEYDIYKYLFWESEVEFAFISTFAQVDDYLAKKRLPHENAGAVYYVADDIAFYEPAGFEKITDKVEINELLSKARTHCVADETDKFLFVKYKASEKGLYSVYVLKG